MSTVTEETYAAAIPKCCTYQTLQEHKDALGLCWGLCLAIEQGEPMDCSGCDLISERNQCDGCARGLPVVNGLHRDRNNRAYMACTAPLYGHGTLQEKATQDEKA